MGFNQQVNMGPSVIQPSNMDPSFNQPFNTGPSIQGDPATRKFGLVFFATLAVMTIGAGVGIGVGNIANYRYFGPIAQNGTNVPLNYTNGLSFSFVNLNLPQSVSAEEQPVTSSRARRQWFLLEKLLADTRRKRSE